jgi:hypothetical protein
MLEKKKLNDDLKEISKEDIMNKVRGGRIENKDNIKNDTFIIKIKKMLGL